jgi:hypothetical protein
VSVLGNIENEISSLPTDTLQKIGNLIQEECWRRREPARAARRAVRGERLVQAREQSGLDLTMVARLAGLIPKTVRRAESGVGDITARTIIGLSNVYGLSCGWLLGYMEKEAPA